MKAATNPIAAAIVPAIAPRIDLGLMVRPFARVYSWSRASGPARFPESSVMTPMSRVFRRQAAIVEYRSLQECRGLRPNR